MMEGCHYCRASAETNVGPLLNDSSVSKEAVSKYKTWFVLAAIFAAAAGLITYSAFASNAPIKLFFGDEDLWVLQTIGMMAGLGLIIASLILHTAWQKYYHSHGFSFNAFTENGGIHLHLGGRKPTEYHIGYDHPERDVKGGVVFHFHPRYTQKSGLYGKIAEAGCGLVSFNLPRDFYKRQQLSLQEVATELNPVFRLSSRFLIGDRALTLFLLSALMEATEKEVLEIVIPTRAPAVEEATVPFAVQLKRAFSLSPRSA